MVVVGRTCRRLGHVLAIAHSDSEHAREDLCREVSSVHARADVDQARHQDQARSPSRCAHLSGRRCLERSPRSASTGSETARAKALLAAQIRKHPILAGTTVKFGNARGYQAIAYYASGRIVISRNHRASLSRIINHEIWHIIDYRDNGKIDWGEHVPPR